MTCLTYAHLYYPSFCCCHCASLSLTSALLAFALLLSFSSLLLPLSSPVVLVPFALLLTHLPPFLPSFQTFIVRLPLLSPTRFVMVLTRWKSSHSIATRLLTVASAATDAGGGVGMWNYIRGDYILPRLIFQLSAVVGNDSLPLSSFFPLFLSLSFFFLSCSSQHLTLKRIKFTGFEGTCWRGTTRSL